MKAGRILIADDEFLVRWSLTQALSQEGYQVTAVGDGKKAVEALERLPFDLIILDLVMPELDGWEVLERARKITPSSRVIIITAHAKEGAGEKARENGAWCFLEKPFIIDQIKEILKEEAGSGIS